MPKIPARTITVAPAEAGQSLAAVLRMQLRLSWSQARRLFQEDRVRIRGRLCRDPNRRAVRGERLEVVTPVSAQPREPALSGPVIRYRDEHLVVVEKPAGLTTMRHPDEAADFGSRARRYLPATLADLLPDLLAGDRAGFRPRVRAVHRIDKETSGLVVFALTVAAERALGQQFREHSIERRYLALVRGRARAGRIESHLVRDRGDGRRGSSSEPGTGQRAVTHVRVVQELKTHTLVECRLETGRTHQVRIHLGEAGTPLCGDHVYDRSLHGSPAPDIPAAPRIALHATRLGLRHPATGKWMVWDSPLPKDLRTFLSRLHAAEQ